MNVLVVGAGAMGRWFGEAVDCEVAFADVDPEVAADAAAELGERTVALETDESFTAVCVAVPIPAATEAIAEHAGKAESAVVDVTGVMADPLEAMAENAPDRERLSLHPLFARANAPGNVAAVVDEAGPTTDRLLSWLRERGNDVVETTAQEHDEAMSTVQAGAHAAVLAFALAADPVPEGLRTPVYDEFADLVETVTGGDPRVYADIQAAFDGAEDVAAAARRVADADPGAFERLYEEAGTEQAGDGEAGR
ncbi:prephenate dehydrogenase [Halomicrococcus gelatinilyticus]|uniref:prephenate dehydrogenase n=1 Tax=Halomicrococcus gelatinilyticus TaxID=1702103 RepID=UPI002E1681E5